jgi:hypothetical protein
MSENNIMNLTKIGERLKSVSALMFGMKGLFIGSGKYLKSDRVVGSQRQKSKDHSPQIPSSHDHPRQLR